MSFLGGFGKLLGGVGKFLDPNAPAQAANAYEKKNTAQQIASLNAGAGAQSIGFGKAEATLRKQLPLVAKNAQDQKDNLALTADRARRTLLAREAPAMAMGNGQVFRAGGVGSNLAPLVSRGVRADTTRAMQQLDEMFQQHAAEIGNQQLAQTIPIYNGIAGIQQNAGNAQAQLGQNQAAAISGQQFIPNGGIGSWLELLGKGAKAGASFGGGGGGGLF
jgi:hypothetical protein